MSTNARRSLYLALVVLFVCMLGLQVVNDPKTDEMVESQLSKTGGNASELMVELPGQFLVATFAGFKEVIAGALWVRADEFFHTGLYQAILPIIRMVTWLDPHNVDVYTTGAWHVGYNFTDVSERSDKRYLPQAIALLKEGIANNPNRWNLLFELGYTHYDRKLEDYPNAIKYYEMASREKGVDPNTGKIIERPAFVDRILAHEYEKVGNFDKAISQWETAIKRAEGVTASGVKSDEYTDPAAAVTCRVNLARLLLRSAWRTGNIKHYKQGVELSNKAKADLPWALAGITADYAKRAASGNPPKDTAKPIDLGLKVKWKRLSPRLLELSGKINMIRWSEYQGLASEVYTHAFQNNEKASANKKQLWRDGSRVHWLFCDEDANFIIPDSFSWKTDLSKTMTWDSVYIGGGSFKTKIDMSKNPDFYPFTSKRYKLIVWFSSLEPGASDFVQDRIGWDGMCLTDKTGVEAWDRAPIVKLFPSTNENASKYNMKYRVIKQEFIINREDII